MTVVPTIPLDNMCNFYLEVMSGAVLDQGFSNSAPSSPHLDQKRVNDSLRRIRQDFVTKYMERGAAKNIEAVNPQDMAHRLLREAMQPFRETLNNVFHPQDDTPEDKQLRRWITQSAQANGIDIRAFSETAYSKDDPGVMLAVQQDLSTLGFFKHLGQSLTNGFVPSLHEKVLSVTSRAIELESNKHLNFYTREKNHSRTAFTPRRPS